MNYLPTDRIIYIEGVPDTDPPTGHYFSYIDPSDGKLKLKDDTGAIDVITTEENTRTLQNTSTTITVGSGGDFSTLEAALAEASRLYPLYQSGGTNIEISLLSGFALNESIHLKNIDLSHVVITSEDAEVNANPGAGNPTFSLDYSHSPIIDFLVNMQDTGSHLIDSAYSTVVILSGAGVKNPGTNGIYAQHSTIYGEGAILTGAAVYGINVDRGCFASLQGADASGAGTFGFRVSSGGIVQRKNATGTNSQTPNIVTGDGLILTTGASNQMAAQEASNVAVTGGAIDGTPIGQTSKDSGRFTDLESDTQKMSDTLEKVVKNSDSDSFDIVVNCNAPSGVYNVGKITLDFASVGNNAPELDMLYVIQFRSLNSGHGGISEANLGSANAAPTISVSTSGLDITISISGMSGTSQAICHVRAQHTAGVNSIT